MVQLCPLWSVIGDIEQLKLVRRDFETLSAECKQVTHQRYLVNAKICKCNTVLGIRKASYTVFKFAKEII